MSRLKANITANLFGQILLIITQLVTLPIYLHTLGVEAYGLVGFYVTLQATIQAFDFGLGNTINREMSKYNSGIIDSQRAINTVVTAEAIFLTLISFLGIIACVAIPFYYTEVISTQTIAQSDIETTLYLMGALIGLLWMSSLYQNGLMGLEKQVSFNAIRSVTIVANPIITLSALYVFGPQIQVFFLSQIFCSIIFVLYLRFTFFKRLHIPPTIKPVYSFTSLSGLKNYMLGMGAISIAGVLCSVSDRWILINMVDLKSFAHYTLALTMSNALFLVISPIFATFFPRFTSLISSKSFEEFGKLYVTAAQTFAVIVIAISAHLFLYSHNIFGWWLRDLPLANEVYPIAQLLIVGTALNGLMTLPFTIQLSFGWVKLGIMITFGLLFAYLPLAFYLVSLMGPIGCALAWLILNFSYFFIGGFLINKKLSNYVDLPNFFINILPIGLSVISVALLTSWMMPADINPLWGIFYIGVSGVICLAVGAMTGKYTRLHMFKLSHTIQAIVRQKGKAL